MHFSEQLQRTTILNERVLVRHLRLGKSTPILSTGPSWRAPLRGLGKAVDLTTLLVGAATNDRDRDAVVGLSRRLSWRDFEHATAATAAALVATGVHPGDRVGVMMSKDLNAFVAVHGILRAGAVVVPVDPLAPPLVAASVLGDAGAAVAFLDSRSHRRLDSLPDETDGLSTRIVVGLDREVAIGDGSVIAWDDFATRGAGRRLPRVRPQDPAYIIYTSGSTGRPKGIVHTHASAMAYAERAAEAHGLSATDRVAGMSPLHFDMSTFELYAAPLASATVVVFGEAQLRFPATFTARSQDERVSVWYSVPSLFRQVAERGALETRDLSDLRLVMYGGEPYPAGAVAELMDALPKVEVKNIYGPAEVNECTNHRLDRNAVGKDAEGDVPIGHAWRDVAVRVVADDGTDVRAGTPGELWISAPTVMQGYWQRPDLDEASLVPRADGPSWYRTGDIVTANDDGQLWFNGRRDHQVKVRGIRIELEAVETVLADAPDVLHAVVGGLGPPGETSHLVAAVVLRDGADLDADALLDHCVRRLPPMAVPRSFVRKPQFPTTPTGKIDRKAIRFELNTEGQE